jgi:hypothetical protein
VGVWSKERCDGMKRRTGMTGLIGYGKTLLKESGGGNKPKTNSITRFSSLVEGYELGLKQGRLEAQANINPSEIATEPVAASDIAKKKKKWTIEDTDRIKRSYQRAMAAGGIDEEVRHKLTFKWAKFKQIPVKDARRKVDRVVKMVLKKG